MYGFAAPMQEEWVGSQNLIADAAVLALIGG
jgi:hypothetical protein